MEKIIRDAEIKDLPAINEIYNYYVLNSTCTYQFDPETLSSREEWFKAHGTGYPVIVCEADGIIAGWASLSRFHRREGYNRTVENSVYVHKDYQGMGLGSLLLNELVRLAGKNGYHTIIAGISADQEPSIRLHEKFGFKKCAHLAEAGFKFGRWLDVVYYQLMIQLKK